MSFTLDHGIGRFEGLQMIPGDGGGEGLVLEYAEGARLYVPLDQAWQVARYVGIGKTHPSFPNWATDAGRERAKKPDDPFSTTPHACCRCRLNATSKPGFSFGPDTHWQGEFEDAFPFEETPDQIKAIAETKEDMESERPMDRLDLRGCRVWKDRSCHSGDLQGRHGRQAGGAPGSDDRPGAAALSDPARTHERIPSAV